MTFFVHLDEATALPRYLQIVRQVRLAVAAGSLRAGDQLPAVRELAARLRVNPGTVVKAYDELESTGVIERRQGSGTFVAPGKTGFGARETRRWIEKAVRGVVADARRLGLSDAEVREILNETLKGR